jgi:hypothetical protein
MQERYIKYSENDINEWCSFFQLEQYFCTVHTEYVLSKYIFERIILEVSISVVHVHLFYNVHQCTRRRLCIGIENNNQGGE